MLAAKRAKREGTVENPRKPIRMSASDLVFWQNGFDEEIGSGRPAESNLVKLMPSAPSHEKAGTLPDDDDFSALLNSL